VKTFNIIFAGTPNFAVPTLDALIKDSSFEISAVLTQPDRPKGRGQQFHPSPIKTLAQTHHLPVLQPYTLKDEAIQQTLRTLRPDVIIVVAYGLLLPQAVLDIPPYGCINVHGSLLPRWRGAAPVQRAIEHGDKETGISIMQMEKGLDTGSVYHTKSCAITEEMTGEILMDKLAHLGAEALLEVLKTILNGQQQAIPQNNFEASYAHKLEKNEGHLNWNEEAATLARRIRAFTPWPSCTFEHQGQRIKVGKAHVVLCDPHPPGTRLSCDKNGLVIACQKDALCITEVQFPGKKMLPISSMLAHFTL